MSSFPFQPRIIIAQSTGVFPWLWWELDQIQNEVVWQGAEDLVENRDSGGGLKQQSLKQPFTALDISQQKNFLELCLISTIQFREPWEQSRSRSAVTSLSLYHSRTQLFIEVRHTDCRENTALTELWCALYLLCPLCSPPLLFIPGSFMNLRIFHMEVMGVWTTCPSYMC